jgi:hypothetical protein
VASKVFEEATTEAMGSTFHTIICFHMKQMLCKDPFEALVDDPKAFYNGLEKILGTGAEAVLSLVYTFLAKKYKTDYTNEEFVKTFTQGDEQSKRKLKETLAAIAQQQQQQLATTK